MFIYQTIAANERVLLLVPDLRDSAHNPKDNNSY
jgi:hypothetical protein